MQKPPVPTKIREKFFIQISKGDKWWNYLENGNIEPKVKDEVCWANDSGTAIFWKRKEPGPMGHWKFAISFDVQNIASVSSLSSPKFALFIALFYQPASFIRHRKMK